MATSDGISGEDWDVISQLAAEMAQLLVQKEECRTRIFEELRRLEEKYGPLPSILATRADLTEVLTAKEALLLRAYSLAEPRADQLNGLYISHSLAQFYIQDRPDRAKALHWLSRLKTHLIDSHDHDMAKEYRSLCEELAKRKSR